MPNYALKNGMHGSPSKKPENKVIKKIKVETTDACTCKTGYTYKARMKSSHCEPESYEILIF